MINSVWATYFYSKYHYANRDGNQGTIAQDEEERDPEELPGGRRAHEVAQVRPGMDSLVKFL